jgi:hypothetical protein
MTDARDTARRSIDLWYETDTVTRWLLVDRL